MVDKKLRLRRTKRRKIVSLAMIVAIVGFLTWTLISALTMESGLVLETTYRLPEFANLESVGDIDGGSLAVAIDGEVVTDFEGTTVRPTASTAKMILGLAIMREKPFNLGENGETITINSDFYQRYLYYVMNGGSYTKVQLGEEISEYDALVSVFLASSNNMADILAVWAFGSLENYQEYANNMLAELGIKNTIIGPDASGFNPATTSTAEDLARIGDLVLKNPVLKEIVGTSSHTVPVAGLLTNTNKLLGVKGISGIKTGWIGDISGYCLVSSYPDGEHEVVVALLGAASRDKSFNDSLTVITKLQDLVKEEKIVKAGEIVGSYNSWWTGLVEIKASEDLVAIGWESAEKRVDLEMTDENGVMKIGIGNNEYSVKVIADKYNKKPNLWERIRHVFGWEKENSVSVAELDADEETEEAVSETESEEPEESEIVLTPITNAPSNNCTIRFGNLMLINPNFMVGTDFISARRGELISLYSTYGISELHTYNGDNLLDAEAAEHLNEMLAQYKIDNPGHEMQTVSCFRSVGTSCGRLCAATGASDHHTGLTCDLIDATYGTELDSADYDQHIDWQWLYNNSYKYGFIDRFPEAWAGGSMSEPLNVDENGSTGLFETWHYRYVGVQPATEIATGKYNNGAYDSLEHYLKALGLVTDLKGGTCN